MWTHVFKPTASTHLANGWQISVYVNKSAYVNLWNISNEMENTTSMNAKDSQVNTAIHTYVFLSKSWAQ